MDFRIETLSPKKLVGKTLQMTLAQDQTPQLWGSFMPHRKEVMHRVGADFFSIQVYDPSLDFASFGPQTIFTKCAMVEVSEFENIPEGMETHTMKGGLYAVFVHRGPVHSFPKTMQYIFGSWLPQSEYELDQREHFELLGEKYNPTSAESEEEVWIPIRQS